MTTTEDLHARILKQVEFYFSDANLPRDKFLSEQVSKNEQGWVDLAVIGSFSRMRAMTTDLETVAEALKGSKGFLELSEDGKSVRRVIPLESGAGEDTMSRTFYIKGFPRDASITLDVIESVLTEAGITDVQAIRMRRFAKSKDFRGSAFIEMKTPEAMQCALTCHPKWEDKLLSMESKQAYLLRKNEERTAAKQPEAKPDIEFAKGCLLVVKTDETEHVAFKASLESKLADLKVAFADFKADGTAMVRLKEPRAAELVAALPAESEARLATEAEETEYYAALNKFLREKETRKRQPSGRQGSARKARRNDEN